MRLFFSCLEEVLPDLFQVKYVLDAASCYGCCRHHREVGTLGGLRDSSVSWWCYSGDGGGAILDSPAEHNGQQVVRLNPGSRLSEHINRGHAKVIPGLGG